ncbi:MAG: hypothetical protein IJA60_03915 [Clostridia bacterium]|nr:hypothetical protein [Clostridia bacterium]
MKNSNKKAQTKGFIKGILFSILVIATIVSMSAAQMTKNATLNYNNIKICIDGNYVTPKDAAGNVVEPFIIDGTTYLPVRAVASALGKEVTWDGATSTVFLGKQPSSAVEEAGTRSNPYLATVDQIVEYSMASYYPLHQYKLKCNKVVKGEGAAFLMKKANSIFNDTPTASQEWIVFDMELTHISSSKGADDLLDGSDIVRGNNFFKDNGARMPVVNTGIFTSVLAGFHTHEVELYPGASSRIVFAILTEKYDGDILLRVSRDENNYNWFKLNSEDNVITTQAQVKKYYGI